MFVISGTLAFFVNNFERIYTLGRSVLQCTDYMIEVQFLSKCLKYCLSGSKYYMFCPIAKIDVFEYSLKGSTIMKDILDNTNIRICSKM